MLQSRTPRFLPRPLSVALGLALTPFAAQAQEVAPAAPGRLETVTVTAERRVENIKDVPVSVSTVNGEALDVLNSSGQDVRVLAARVPSLNIESSFGRTFPRFYIRGLGNTDFDLNASQPVSLVFDDVVQENPVLKGFPLFDLEGIEVLRGPQGTLFGRNSPAGVVKFESAKPKFTPGGYFNVSYGSYATTNVEGAYNIPLSPEWAARISVQAQHRDDWVDNSFEGGQDEFEGYDDNAARLQLLYKPNARFSALFNVHGRDLDGTARLFRANIIKPGSNDTVGSFDEDEVSIDGRNTQSVNSNGGSVRLRWAFDEYTLHAVTGYESVSVYSRGDVDGGFGAVFAPPSGPGFIPFPSESADAIPDHQQFSQEFRLESDYKGPLNWQAGVYYFDEDLTIDSYSYDTLAGGVENGFARQQQENTAWAVFGSVKYALSDKWGVRAGLRYTHDEKDFTARRYTSPIGGGATGTLSADPSDNNVSWDLSTTYALTPDTNLYARVATGFRAPSIQGRILFGDTLSVADSETVLSYEAGIKSDLFDRRARASLSVFRYTVEDQQLTAVGGDANFNRLINADESEAYGIELDLQAYLTDNLLATLGASYNHTEIKDDGLYITPCGAGCSVTDPAGPNGTVSIDGNPLPQAPEWIANFTLRYGIPLADGELYVYTDWAYRSEVNFFLYEAEEFEGKPLLEGGLRLGYVWQDGKYEMAAFGRNITNQVRVVGGIDFNNLTGFVNEPRTYGVQFKAAF